MAVAGRDLQAYGFIDFRIGPAEYTYILLYVF